LLVGEKGRELDGERKEGGGGILVRRRALPQWEGKEGKTPQVRRRGDGVEPIKKKGPGKGEGGFNVWCGG